MSAPGETQGEARGEAPGETAVVVGAAGGVGAALVRALAGRPGLQVHAWSRAPAPAPSGVRTDAVDLLDEASLAQAAARLAHAPPLTRVFVATGLLHAAGLAPERSLAELGPEALARLFAANATGPMLVAKHLLPRVPRDRRAVFAALSARVGSLGDNRLGGWYGYRASKAALNMLIRTASVELARSRPLALIVGLHPGTVETPLSAPFQARVPPGRLRTPDRAAADLIGVSEALEPSDSGGVFDYLGQRLPD